MQDGGEGAGLSVRVEEKGEVSLPQHNAFCIGRGTQRSFG